MSWHHSDWLSFAQAVGSFGAIVGAFAVVLIQHRLEKQRLARVQREEARRVLMVLTVFVERLHSIVDGIAETRSDPNHIEKPDDRNQQRYDLSNALEIFKILPLQAIPTLVATEEIVKARVDVGSATIAAMTNHDKEMPGSAEYGATWREWSAALKGSLKAVEAEMAKFNERGSHSVSPGNPSCVRPSR